MSTSDTAERGATNLVRVAFGVGGIVAVIVGILILVWPGQSVVAVTAIIAIWAIVAGLVDIGAGIFTRGKGGWARVGYIVLGLVFIAAGIIALFNLSQTAVFLALFLAILVGILWIVDGIVALSTLGDASSKTLTIIYAILSIVAGAFLLFSPLISAIALLLLLGISLIVLGVVQAVRAFTFGRGR